MSDCGLCGDYFERNFFNQFIISDESIVASPEAVHLIAEILQNENNKGEESQFIKEIIQAERLAGYATDAEIYLESYQCNQGNIRDITIYFCYTLTNQRIIDFINEKQEFLFQTLRIPESKNRHLRMKSMVRISKITVSNNTLGVQFEFSFIVEKNEDFFLDVMGKNKIRYKLKKDHHGQSLFDVKAAYHTELIE